MEAQSVKSLDPKEEYSRTHLARLLSPAVKSILIKGNPGTGKTTLALKLLTMAGSGTYVSTRVGSRKLSEQNPDLKGLEEGGHFDQVKVGNAKLEFSDVRLGGTQDMLEQLMKSIGDSRSVIVFDSWDSLAKEMDPNERLKTEKTMSAMIDASKSKAIFISEEPNQTTTDYLVDAIVTLYDKEFEGRRFREIEWNKLRGAEIPAKKSPFSLNEGRIRLIEPPETRDGVAPQAFKPIPHTDKFYSTGSRELDLFLGGGLEKGGVILCEIGKTVGTSWQRPIGASIRCNFIANGGCTIAIPSVTMTPMMVIESVEPFLGGKRIESNLKVLTFEGWAGHSSLHEFGSDNPKEAFKTQMQVAKLLKGEKDRPCFWSIHMDTYETYLRELDSKFFSRFIIDTRVANDSAILWVTQSSKSTDLLSDLCYAHLRLEELAGCPILYSKRPPGRAYAITFDYAVGYPQVHLTPMV